MYAYRNNIGFSGVISRINNLLTIYLRWRRHYMSVALERPLMALETEIAFYETNLTEYERYYQGKYVVIHGSEFAGAFDTFENAAVEAVRRFAYGPYLIRQVGAPPPSIPISWICRPAA